jgi:multimeric flavodoxin WrbA
LKIIAFSSSPRQAEHRNPDERASCLQAVMTLPSSLNSLNIKPCQDCGGCVKTGVCIQKDAMTDIFAAIRETDRIIFASPIFFYSLSAQAKAMVDRCQSFWCEKYLLKRTIPAGPHGRKGLLLLVGGMKKDDGRVCAEAVAKGFFRTCSVPVHETLFYGGVDARGDIMKHPTALTDAREAGKRLGA